jgi:hypothetical protein
MNSRGLFSSGVDMNCRGITTGLKTDMSHMAVAPKKEALEDD